MGEREDQLEPSKKKNVDIALKMNILKDHQELWTNFDMN